MNPITIDVVSDFVCPWCLIGTRRLASVLAEEGAPQVVLRHHPYLLHADAPPEGIDVAAMIRQRYGSEPTAMFERVEAEARKSGIPLELKKQPRSYSTLGAHTLTRHAALKGTQAALVSDLFTAHFLEARNISSLETLATLAQRHGFEVDEALALLQDPAEQAQTRAEAAKISEAGVTGVPFFIFGEREAVSGAQPEEALRAALKRAVQQA